MSKLKFIPLILISILTLGISSCGDEGNPAKPSEENKSITGMVKSNSGSFVSGARIEIVVSGESSVMIDADDILSDDSDAKGAFDLRLASSELSGFLLRVTHADYKPLELDLAGYGDLIKAGTALAIEMFPKEDCCGRILVRPYQDNHHMVPYALMKVYDSEGKLAGISKAMDPETGIEVNRLCIGTYKVVIQHPDFADHEFLAEIKDCDPVSKDVHLVPRDPKTDPCCNSKIEIALTDAQGNAINEGKALLLKRSLPVAETKIAAGKAVFVNLCPGLYDVEVNGTGYRQEKFGSEINCGETAALALTLEPIGSCCDGRVSFSFTAGNDHHSELFNAEMRLTDKDGNIKTKIANGDYMIRFTDLCEGTWKADVTAEGHHPISFEFVVDCNQSPNIHKVLQLRDTCCNSSVDFSIADQHGNPVKNAYYRFRKYGSMTDHSFTGEDGRISFDNLCAAAYSLTIEKKGYESAKPSFNLTCGEAKDLVITMKKSGSECCQSSLSLEVGKHEGKHEVIPGTTVSLWLAGEKIAEAITGNDGKVFFSGLCEDEFRVVLYHPDYGTREGKVQTDCNKLSNDEIYFP